MATKLKVVSTTKRSILRASDSYLFRDKHPLIDMLRTKMQDEHVTYADITQKTGVSMGTLVKWFDGTTRRPQATTLNQVAAYFGMKLDWAEIRHDPKTQRSWLEWKASKDTTWQDWYDKS